MYLISTFPSKGYNIDDYPAVKEYLLGFGIERLEQTGKEYFINSERVKARKKTTNKWFETQDSISYWDEFSKPKIIWKRVGSIIRFSYDTTGILGLDSTCFATGEDIQYICCVLNSPMGHYLLNSAPRTGTGDLLISVQAVEPLRLPIISAHQKSVFNKLLNKLILGEQVDLELNAMIYDLYGLSEEERKYITEYYS